MPRSATRFYVANAHYVFADLKTWGWIVLILGILQLLVGLGVLVENQFARWTGVVILGLNALAQLLLIPAYPFWSLAIFAIDILADLRTDRLRAADRRKLSSQQPSRRSHRPNNLDELERGLLVRQHS